MASNRKSLGNLLVSATLYESDSRLAAIFNQMSAGIAETDLSGRFVLVNPKYCKIVGRSTDELLRMRMQDITHPDDVPRNAELTQRLIETGQNFAIESRCVRADGSIVGVSNNFSLVRAADGTPQYVLAVALDRSERTRAKERLVSHDLAEHHIESRARDVLIECAKATGLQFLEILVRAMAEVFGTRYAIVGERKLHEPEVISTLAVWDSGRLLSNFEYTVAGLPCQEVIEQEFCLYEDQVRRHFPNQPLLERLNVEAYVGKPLRAASGEIIGLLTIVHDQPLKLNPRAQAILEMFAGRAGAELERLRSSRTLEERELLLRVVTDHAPMLIAYVDHDHCYRFSNHTYQKWFGVDEIAGCHVREVVGGEAYLRVLPRLNSALSGNEVTFEDFVPYLGRGRYVQTTYVPHRDARGQVHGLVAIVQDITERHRAERWTEFLAEANSLLSGSLDYEQALSEITHLIVPSLADWCAVDVLKEDGTLELKAALHWHPEKNQLIREMREKHPLKLDSPVGVPLVARTGKPVIYAEVTEPLLRAAAEDDDHFDMLCRLSIQSAIIVPLTLHGHTLAVMTLVSGESHYRFGEADLPMLEELARRCALVMENARLYSAAKKEIAERTRAENALHEEVKRKDDFLAILGHELRNPLAPIRACLDILQRSDSSREQVQRTRETMARQVRHMGRLIDDLLDVSRISQGKIPLERQELDLAQVVRETVEDHQGSLTAKSLQLNLGLPSTPVWMSGDPVRISQALINLLRNAVSFTDVGGRISINLHEAENFAVLTVADSGIGMEPSVVTNLFQPFSQADRTLDRSRGGLGLGLAVVKGIIELHGGTVSAASAGLGRGSEFTLRLPLLIHRDEQTVSAKPSESQRRRRVLIIEDNRDIADTMQVLLELLGHEVALGYDGVQGICLAREFHPDVVLCDLGLPGEFSGFAVAKTLREDAQARSTYLVAVTGYGGEQDKARSLAAGFDRHLCKPVGAEALEQLLAALPH